MKSPTRPFIHYLSQLRQILTRHKPDSALLTASLSADMFPLHQQISTAISFSLRCCCAMTGEAIVSYNKGDSGYQALIEEIDSTVAYLSAIPPEKFEQASNTSVSFEAGFAHHTLPADDFYQLYAFPNFLFHLNMAYAILRMHGCPLSKADFDGFHEYPVGFTFQQ